MSAPPNEMQVQEFRRRLVALEQAGPGGSPDLSSLRAEVDALKRRPSPLCAFVRKDAGSSKNAVQMSVGDLQNQVGYIAQRDMQLDSVTVGMESGYRSGLLAFSLRIAGTEAASFSFAGPGKDAVLDLPEGVTLVRGQRMEVFVASQSFEPAKDEVMVTVHGH